MPKWAIQRGISQASWNKYMKYLQGRYGWRAGLLSNNSSYYDQYMAIVSRPATIGPDWARGATQPTVQATSPTTQTTSPADEENKTYQGFTADEWGLGIPQWLEQRKQQQIQQIDWLNQMSRNYWYGTQLGQQKGWTGNPLDLASGEAALSQAVARQQEKAQQAQAARTANESQFEQDRNNLLSSLDPSRDWIQRYIIERTPNPYKQEAGGWATPEHTAAVEELTALREGGGSEGDIAAAYNTALGLAQQYEEANYNPRAVRGEFPNAPDWLANLVPGLKGGQMITRQNVPTPSGQQLTQMPQSQLSMLGGYAGWAGQNWRDILGQAQLMQPETPRTTRRWRPIAQRA